MWGLVVRAGATLGTRLLTTGGALRLWLGRVVGASRGSALLKSLWKALGAGLTAWTIYDIFWGSKSEDDAKAAYDNTMQLLLCAPVNVVLTVPLNDIEAVASAYIAAGIRLIEDRADASTVRGVSLLGVGVYVSEVAFGSTYYTPDQIKEVIKNETSNFLVEQGGLEESDADSVASELGDIDFASLDYSDLRRYDYLAWLFTQLGEVEITEEKPKDNGNNENDGGRFQIIEMQ